MLTDITDKDDNLPENIINLQILPYLIFISIIFSLLNSANNSLKPHALTLQKCLLVTILAMFCACKRHFYINAFNRHDKRPGNG